jgi:nitrite reductase/ring-hydroxylating ferredoxin subunit
VTRPAPSRIAAGSLQALSAGQVRVLRLPKEASGIPREALLLRDQQGTPRAYLNRCKHLPIPLDAGGRRFLTDDATHLQCRTHGARYRLDDGHCVDGPCAGTALQQLPLELEGDELYVLIDA